MTRTRIATFVLFVSVLLGPLLGTSLTKTATAAEPNSSAASSALAWIQSQQRDDGGFPGFSGESDPSTTADIVYAFAAAGIAPDSVLSDTSNSPLDFLLTNAAAAAEQPASAAKLALALHASGVDATNVDGINLIASTSAGFDPETGLYGVSFYGHCLAVLALTTADVTIEPAALQAFETHQMDDGSWNFNGETETADTEDSPIGDSNTTALALQALIAAGADGQVIDDGLDYLRSTQATDGSFAFDLSQAPDLAGDANSTALAIQALVAAGIDPAALANGNALDALANFQNPDGSLFWQAAFGVDPNMLATAQAIPAFLLQPLPVNPATVSPPSAKSLQEALLPADARANCDYVEATSHNLCANFQLYWNENGGLKIFGYPLSESFEQNGVQVQYFERARFEWHPGVWPENHDILLGRIGAEAVESLATEN